MTNAVYLIHGYSCFGLPSATPIEAGFRAWERGRREGRFWDIEQMCVKPMLCKSRQSRVIWGK